MTNVGPAYEPRTLRLKVAKSGEIRAMSLHNDTYYAVPVVALVEGVVWPANAEEPEFVPAEVLAEHPLGWNGKPVTQSHPQENGEFTSANFPDIYERYAYGLIFNAVYEDRKLKMEAWINPKLIRPGSVAERSWEALKAGEMVEVSVGAYITRKKVRGTFNGTEYSSIWMDLVPDHLAILSEGEIGACSIEMGCGALRVAKQHIHEVTNTGIKITEVEMAAVPATKPNTDEKVFCTKHPTVEVQSDSECTACVAEKPPKKSWTQRFQEILSKFTAATNAEDMTTYDLQDALDRKLRATEPGYLGTVAVKPEAGEVVYAVYPEDRIIYYQRSYSVSDGGEITLADNRVEVQETRKWEPVSATAASPTVAAGKCGCQNKPAAVAQTESSGEEQMNKETKINALIGSGKFAEANRAFLTSLDDATIDKMLEAPAPAAATSASTPAAQPAVLSGASEQTMEQYIAAAPEHLRDGLRAAHQANLAKRNANIAALKASGRNPFTDAQLASKNDQEIEQLATLAAAPTSMAADYSGRGMPNSTSSEAVPEPPSLVTAIQSRRKVAGVEN